MITWYVLTWFDKPDPMYVNLPYHNLHAALLALTDKMNPEERLKEYQRIEQLIGQPEKEILCCSDDSESSKWILCHHKLINSLLKEMSKKKIQVLNYASRN